MNVSDELLDVVDGDDNLVEVRRRGDIHRLGLMHRAIHILLFNSQDELFLQKRAMQKDENPGLWDSSAAGHLDSGEDYLQCAVREIGEELGITTNPEMKFLFKLPPAKSNGFEHSVIYHAVYDGPLKLQVEEIDEGLWIDSHEMDARVRRDDPILTEVLKQIWKRYRQF